MSKRISKRVGAILLAGAVLITSVVASMGVLNFKSEARENKDIKFAISGAAMIKPSVRTRTEAVYNDDYFREASTVYNNDLALISVQLGMASASTAESFDRHYGENMADVAYVDYDYIDMETARNGYMVEAYRAMGFENDRYIKYETSLNDTSDTAAYAIASKKIRIDGKRYNLVNVTVRGASYGGEWASNYVMSNEKGLTSFENAAEDMYANLKEYIHDYKLNKSNTKIWITGFSRGGGVSNIVGAALDRASRDKVLKINRDNIYVYAFATPKGVLVSPHDDVHDSLYDNIFNILINTDIVPMTMPAKWNYDRYGRTIYINQPHISGKNIKRIEAGKKVDIDDETVELIKRISRTYNECRYYYEGGVDLNAIFGGLAVKEEFTKVIDTAFFLFGDCNQDYVDKWQNVIVDMVPFAIAQARKYDSEQGIWVAYDTLAEYIAEEFDPECVNKAVEVGVFSQKEYSTNLEGAKNLYIKGTIDKEAYGVLRKVIDTYYGVKILAVYYGIDEVFIKEAVDRLTQIVWPLLKGVTPIGDTLNFKMNHYGEYYMAWLKHYNPYTNEILEVSVE